MQLQINTETPRCFRSWGTPVVSRQEEPRKVQRKQPVEPDCGGLHPLAPSLLSSGHGHSPRSYAGMIHSALTATSTT